MPETVLGTDLAEALGSPIDASDAANWPIASGGEGETPAGYRVVDDSGNPVVDGSGNGVVS